MHDFKERLNFSEGVDLTDGILRHIYRSVPGAVEVLKNESSGTDHGTDYWVSREHGLPSISVDMKNRSYCPVKRWGSDDACIETVSVYVKPERRKVGWTLDESKRTDLVVYTWPSGEGLRFWILYFPLLCQAARLNWESWRDRFGGEKPAENDGYQTLSVYPPRKQIALSIRELSTGVL